MNIVIKGTSIYFAFFSLLVLLTVSRCGSDNYTYEGDGDLIVKFYKKYRFFSNRIITFSFKDEISIDKAKKRRKFFKAFYNETKKIVRVETYIRSVIRKRQIFDPNTGSLIKLELFKEGKLKEYVTHFYDEEIKNNLVKKEVYNGQNTLKRVEKYGFGNLDEIDHYDSKGFLTKTEGYVGRKVDVTKYYDGKGNVVKEKGTYDNGRYPYILEYFYNDANNLIRVEHSQKNKLVEMHYYNSDGTYLKEEKYNGRNNLIKTILLDADGNPIKEKK